ncbi:non-ribosomal peptide synthetase [Paenibacillus sp. NAIST15-1]|uniref:non-ribosomal peptide synthetase n=1 Tax=Paenibacillus sp. NAIST15-1 TaxID=1605994 RepID=UPI0009F82C1F|nr:non-ribosomal peptide synthetase [Paenibacillus sp. NAIST15-1]
MASEKKMLYPLTHPQKRIWYIEKIYPTRPIHNIGGLVWIKGNCDVALLEEAIHLFVESHGGVRIQITERDGDVLQYFEEYRRRQLQMLDFSGCEDPKVAVSEWAETEFGKPFELLEQPLFQFAIFKANEQLNGYFVKFHHLVTDGWSIQIMTKQINQFYTKLHKGEIVEPEIESGYAEYVVQEQSYLSSARFEKNKRYWLEKFRTIPESFLQRSSNELSGKRKTFWLDESLSYAIKQYIQKNRCSLNTFFLSLVLLYQHKITQQRDLIIGTPVLNRSGAKEKRIMGMFTSTLPFRTTVESGELVSGFIGRVNKELMESYYHQRFPYNLLVQELELRKKGYDQLFQICVNYYNTKLVGEWEGSEVENEELYCGQQHYSLQVVIKEWTETGKLEIRFDYQTGDYTDEAVEKLFMRLTVLAKQVVNPKEEITIGELQLMSVQERSMLVHKWNATEECYPKDKPVHQLIAEQAVETPEKIAAVWENRSLTYAELVDFADRLAHRLAGEGIGKGNVVALLLNHSFETLIAIVAVLKTGAAYLPLDIAYPGQRIRYLLEDSQADMLLCNVDGLEDSGYSGKQMWLDMRVLERMQAALEPYTVAISPNDPAYVIYTSGSTGNPKGVVIKHQGLTNYTWWARKTYYLEEGDVTALYSSLAFDLTITSIFPPLINGNTVAIYPATEEEFILERIIGDNIATVLKLTPAHLALIKHRDNSQSSIRMLIVGGENLKSAVAADIHRSFAGRATIINEYGPTETVVGCIIHRFDPESDRQGFVPIGHPIANTQIYLLNEQLQPVPEEVIGEIYIAGDGVAAGYLRRPELTGKQFVENVFAGVGTMYKTDDLAMRRPDGSIEYVGRSDSQIKFNGYRIELGEVENYLMRIEGIREAVVIARTDAEGTTALAAYLVANRRDMSAFTVRKTLLDWVPAYMVPQYIVFLDVLPMTLNGKVDRKALPDPEAALQLTDQSAPNERQEILLKVMSAVLQSDHVSLQDNFYRLGGDSIKAIQVMVKLNEAGLSLQVKDILSFPVIGELLTVIEQRNSSKEIRIAAEGDVRPTPITEWFFSQALVNPHHYNQSVLLSVKRRASPEQISLALKDIAYHHDSLRLKLDKSTGLLRYFGEFPDYEINLEVVTLDDFREDELENVIYKRSLACKQSIHMSDGPLFKATLFQNGRGTDLLFLTAHHLIVDAVSWRILLDDLERMLQARLADQQIPPLGWTDSYQVWAEAVAAYSHGKAEGELFYWQTIIETVELPLKTDYESGVSTIGDTKTLYTELSSEDTARLLKNANRAYNTQPLDLLVTALALTCNAMNGKRQFTIEMEAHGREPIVDGIDVSRTVGWFTSIYPARLDLPDADIGEKLKTIKEQLHAIPNQGIGYGALTLARKLPPLAARTIRFNYLGEIDNQMQSTIFELADYVTGEEQAAENTFAVLLDLVLYIQNKQLKVSVTYSSKDFQRSTVEHFAHYYIEQLQRLVRHCSDKTDIDFTPSDFETTSLNKDELDSLFA